jgi:hypothetical protein
MNYIVHSDMFKGKRLECIMFEQGNILRQPLLAWILICGDIEANELTV